MVLEPTYSSLHNDYGTIHAAPGRQYPVQRSFVSDEVEGECDGGSAFAPREDGGCGSMTQGDLYQRQPLLPTPTKASAAAHQDTWRDPGEYYDHDDDDSINGLHTASVTCNGIVKITVPPPVREEPKFPKEKWKTLLGEFVPTKKPLV